MRRAILAKTASLVLGSVLIVCSLTACERKKVVLDDVDIVNFEEPKAGDEVAVLTIRDMGDVTIRLFPDKSPTGVENFKKLIEAGYYDDLIFHRVIKDFVIQSGDPKGDGTGGDDCWGTGGFTQTISPDLCHVTGAVAYATATDKRNKSQFYIVTGGEVTEEHFDILADQYGKGFGESVKELYYKWGGQPVLDNDYEVFGQVIGGMDICLRIQNAETDENDKPKSQIAIEKAVIVPYEGGAQYLNWRGESPETESSGEEG